MVPVDIQPLSGADARIIAANAARIADEQNVSEKDYVLGLHLNVEAVGPFVALVNKLRCRALVIEPNAKARVLLEKNLWLNSFGESLSVYCPESAAQVEDVDLETYTKSFVILPGIVHNKYERAVFSKGRLYPNEHGMRCHSFQDIVGKRNVAAVVLGDAYAEEAVRGYEHRVGDIIVTNAAAQQAARLENFDETLFENATWVL